jgi:hypothetical protein
MSTTQVRIVGVGLSFLVIFASGLWLSHLGKPYQAGLFAVHKLVGVAVGILLAVIVYQAHQAAPLTALQVAAIAATILLFAATVVAGALLSLDMSLPALVPRLHQVVPVLTLLSSTGTLYLLLGK